MLSLLVSVRSRSQVETEDKHNTFQKANGDSKLWNRARRNLDPTIVSMIVDLRIEATMSVSTQPARN